WRTSTAAASTTTAWSAPAPATSACTGPTSSSRTTPGSAAPTCAAAPTAASTSATGATWASATTTTASTAPPAASTTSRTPRPPGRIYKVPHGQPPRPKIGNVADLSDRELVQLQLHRNDYFVRAARRNLQERAAAGKDMKAVHADLRQLFDGQADVTRQLRAL